MPNLVQHGFDPVAGKPAAIVGCVLAVEHQSHVVTLMIHVHVS